MTTEFTPLASLIGGALIGLSAVILMATSGRIAGISNIVSRLLPPAIQTREISPGILFVSGLALAAPVVMLVGADLPRQTVSNNLVLLSAAGLLVGFGATIGNGCTSGHGVCGISRLSMRSVLATLTFMASGFLTVLVLRHVV